MAEPKQDLEWLIIFLAYNNNYYDLEKKDTIDYYTMEEQTKYIRNQIRNVNYNSKVKAVLVEAQIKNTKKQNSEESVITSTLSILYKKRDRWLSAVDKIWRTEDEIDTLTNIDRLEKLLYRLKNKYNAKKHIVITIGHGSILGINYYIPQLKPKADRINNPENEKMVKVKGKPRKVVTKSLAADFEIENNKKLLFLSNQEIFEVLHRIFQPNKIDVLVMYNCLMQNTFTQYELRNGVDWLVAPLSGISLPGFNYKAVIDKISENPEAISSEDVATLFTQTINKGNKYNKYKGDIEGTWSVTAEKLNKEHQELVCEKFNSFFRRINDLSQTDNRIIYCLYETGRFLFNYSNYCLPSIRVVDLGVFLLYLKDKIIREYNIFEDLISEINDLQKAINSPDRKVVVFKGSGFYNKEGDINYKEHEKLYEDAVANTALFFPLLQFESDLLNFIYDDLSYEDRNGKNKYKIPQFLKDFSYGSVLDKLRKLPD
jgi:hypothetical protein